MKTIKNLFKNIPVFNLYPLQLSLFVIVSTKYICFLRKLINGKFYHDKRSTPEDVKKKKKERNKIGIITECFCAMQPDKVDDSLQEDILDTFSVSMKVIFL